MYLCMYMSTLSMIHVHMYICTYMIEYFEHDSDIQTAVAKPLHHSIPTIVTINPTFVTQLPIEFPSLPNQNHSKSSIMTSGLLPSPFYHPLKVMFTLNAHHSQHLTTLPQLSA